MRIRTSRSSRCRWLVAGAICALVPGCEDSTTGPTSGTGAPDPTLENIWPNADGTTWVFELNERTWAREVLTLHETPAEVPPAPELSDLAGGIDTHAIGDSVESAMGFLRLKFDGEITTRSGATGQNLEEKVFVEVPPVGPGGGTRVESALLARLYVARPDLRPVIVDRTGFLGGLPEAALAEGTEALDRGEDHPVAQEIRGLSLRPVFWHGSAWVRTEDAIVGYGDVDRQIAWKYLAADLSAGSEFTLQLVPSLTDDVFLHVRILRDRQTVDTDAGTFAKAIESIWQIDYGVSQITDTSGVLLGHYRLYDYGTATYAPTIGPVHGYERKFVETGAPASPGIGEITLGLVGTSTVR